MDAKKEYLETKVSPILEPLVLDVLEQNPENLLDFMIDWLTKKRENDAKQRIAQPVEEDKQKTAVPVF